MIDASNTEIEHTAVQALAQGQMAEAMRLIAHMKPESPDPSHEGRITPQSLPPSLVANATFLLTLPYDDLPYPIEVRRLVGAQLAMGVLLWERPAAIAERLLHLTNGQFTCPSLEAFLRHNPPGGLWFYFNPNRPQDRATLYAQTRCVEAAAEGRLKRLLEGNRPMARESGQQGIEIMYAAGHQCETCLQSKRHYRWSELDSLPKLPRHWGCRCMYVPWGREM